MTVIHVQSMVRGVLGRPSFLVVPVPFSATFADLLFRAIPSTGYKIFQGMGGWEIDALYQGPLLYCLQMGGPTEAWKICSECFSAPCEAWVEWVCRRFLEFRRIEQRNNSFAQLAQRNRWQQQNEADTTYTPSYSFYDPYNRPYAPSSVEQQRRWAQEDQRRLEQEAQRRREQEAQRRREHDAQRIEKRRSALATLGLPQSFTKDDLTRAFRKAVLQSHPDRGGTDAAMIAVVEAKTLLLREVT